MNRVKTGVNGLDELIEGGFPQKRSILVSGETGTGKTIFCTQFLIEGALKYKENGLFITLDERPELIREDMLEFGWDLDALEKKKLLTIFDGTVPKVGLPSEEQFAFSATGMDIDQFLASITKVIKDTNAKRVVIDSIPGLAINFENQAEARKAILKLNYIIQKAKVTTLFTTETEEGSHKFSKYGVEEFIADGVILLHCIGAGKDDRILQIKKMRSTNHSLKIHPMKITKKGISIGKIEEILRL